MSHGQGGAGLVPGVAGTLTSSFGRLLGTAGQDADHGHSHLVPVAHVDTMPCMTAGGPSDTSHNQISGQMREQYVVPVQCITGSVTHTLKAEGFDASEDGTGLGQPIVCVHGTQDPCVSGDTAFALGRNSGQENAIAFQTRGSNIDVGEISGTIGTNADRASGSAPMIAFNPNQEGMGISSEITPPIGASTGGGNQNAIALPFDTTQITSPLNYSKPNYGDPCHPLAAGAHTPAVAYTTKLHNTGSNNAGKVFEERTTCLDANSPPPALLTAMQVRRLTPRECERLQGFQWLCSPDYPGAWQDEAGRWWSPDYTLIPWRKKPAEDCPDGPRYKALGNSWAVPNVHWIGKRIDAAIRSCQPPSPN